MISGPCAKELHSPVAAGEWADVSKYKPPPPLFSLKLQPNGSKSSTMDTGPGTASSKTGQTGLQRHCYIEMVFGRREGFYL